MSGVLSCHLLKQAPSASIGGVRILSAGHFWKDVFCFMVIGALYGITHLEMGLVLLFFFDSYNL